MQYMQAGIFHIYGGVKVVGNDGTIPIRYRVMDDAFIVCPGPNVVYNVAYGALCI